MRRSRSAPYKSCRSRPTRRTPRAAGSPVVLHWTTANATSVVLIGGDIPPTTGQPNGSLTINPVSNQTYTLTAYGLEARR